MILLKGPARGLYIRFGYAGKEIASNPCGKNHRRSANEELGMPTYSYRCTECGVQFERYQPFTDPPLVKCPECGKKSLRKVFTPAGIIFKGSGWYATDHKSPSGQTVSREKKSDEASGSAETKPAPAAAPAETKKPSED
jgi:putative FmdB family regulatory protein